MQKTVAVLGGGIGGLSACYHLSKSPQVSKVVLVEGGDRVGGWLHSTRRPDGGVFEHGPRGIRPAGPAGRNTLAMVEEVGLEGELLPVTYDHVASQERFLYVRGQLHRMPSGLGGMWRTTPPFSRPLLQFMLGDLLVSRGPGDDQTVHTFITRRLGAELADIAVDSLCRGVFAGDCRRLSVRSCFPPLYHAEQRRGSILLGMLLGAGPSPAPPPSPLAQRAAKEAWAQWSLRRGLQALPEALQEHLGGAGGRRGGPGGRVELHTHTPVTGLAYTHTGWEIKLEDGTITADHIISALPAKALASVLPPACHTLSEQLRDIATVTVAVVNLEYEGSILPVMGFGHLVPSWEDPGVLGVVYDSVPFPEHDRPGGPTTRLTVMLGGAWFQEVFGSPEEVTEQRLLATASQAIRSHLGVTTEPIYSVVALLKDCIPQYYVGHWKRLENMRRFIRDKPLPLTLAGSSYDGVSVNDVILSGRAAAEALVGGA